MFTGKNIRSKNEILVFMMIELLVDGFLDPQALKNDFHISSLTMYRYVSLIKNVVFDFDYHYIDIYYDRKTKLYRCKFLNNYRFMDSEKNVL